MGADFIEVFYRTFYSTSIRTLFLQLNTNAERLTLKV